MAGLLSRELGYDCNRLNLPAADHDLPLDTVVESQWFLGADRLAGLRTGKSAHVGDVGQFIIADNRSLALLGAEQRTGLALTIDDVVLDEDGPEVAARMGPGNSHRNPEDEAPPGGLLGSQDRLCF